MPWWMRNNLRMIQLNLRDIDARMDIDAEIAVLRDFGVNTVQLGCGGITSFYPSGLECQTPSPWLEGDAFGTWLEKLHGHGIRVIARFDFSKTHERFIDSHPDWFVRTAAGEPIRYHDTVATCVNGPYQQVHSIEILQEALGRYDVDGVFFNMFGYQTRDYSGSYTGICQCMGCRGRFREWSGGLALPTVEDAADPVFQRYLQFKEYTVGDILDRIHAAVKAVSPEIAVSTYHHRGVDIIRDESNSAVDRPLPFWIYQSAENVSAVLGSYPDKISSNVAINAVDLPYRFMGVSRHLNKLRLLGNMASGGGLDWCIIGTFAGYPDRDNLEAAKQVYRFHRRHEQYYGRFTSPARILLVRPDFAAAPEAEQEFRGLFRALKERHRLFRVVEHFRLDGVDLTDCDVILLPALAELTDAARASLERSGALVIATGLSFSDRPDLLGELFGITLGKRLEPVRGAYLATEPKEVFRSFPLRDWVYLDGEFRAPVLAADVRRLLPLVAPARYGPPERCYGHRQTEIPGAAIRGERFVYFPWGPGILFYRHGYEDFGLLLLDVIDAFGKAVDPVVTDAPACVEVFFGRVGEGRYLFQLLNLSGFNGVTVREPVPIYGIEARFPGISLGRIFELCHDGIAECAVGGALRIDCLTDYKAFVLEAD